MRIKGGWWRRALLCLLCAGAASGRAGVAQLGVDAVLSGTVTDQTGARIPGAAVVVEGPVSRTATADGAGRFAVTLPVGSYEVRIASEGFAAYTSKIVLRAAGVRISAELRVGLTEKLEVGAEDAGSTAAADNKSAVTFQSEDLKSFSTDDATFQREVEALAGGAGPRPPQVLIDGFLGGKFPPKSSIREIRINRNAYSAQYQDVGFGRFEVSTKPGTDKLHGGLNVNGNDAALNSRNPFLQTAEPPYFLLNVDGNLTGPINRKTSFYLSGLVNDQQNNAALNATTLTSGSAPGGQAVTYAAAVRDPQLTSTYALRVDRQVTPNNTLTGRYEFSQVTQTNGGLTAPLTLASEAYNSGTTSQTLQLSDTQVIGQHGIAETRFQYVRTRLQQGPVSAAPTLLVEGAFNGGASPQQFTVDSQDRYEFQEYFSHEQGKHFVRVGGLYRLQRIADRSTANYNGQYVFGSLAEFQAGTPEQYSVTLGQASATILSGALSVYAEDEWKLRPNLTLNLGVRVESQSGIPDHFDPAPRIAAAWAILRKGQKRPLLTLRPGGGIFYDRFSASNLLTSVRQNGVSQQTLFVTNPTYNPNGAPAGVALGAVPATPYRVSPSLRSAYNLIGGLAVEHSFGRYGQASVTYLAGRGIHQFLSRNINAPLPGTYNPAMPASGVRPLGGTQNIYEFDSEGFSTSQLLLFNSRINISKYGVFFVSYTINRGRQDVPSGATGFASNSYDLAQDYGRSPQATNQLFTGGTVHLPRGFDLNLFASTIGGIPFNITTGTDLNGDTIYNDRPAFATAPTAASVVYQTRYGTFDANPQPGEKTIPINFGNSPNFAYLDLALSRNFAVGPRPAAAPVQAGAKPGPRPDRPYSLSFTVDATNMLNTRNAAPPVGVLSSPYFGQSLTPNPVFSTNTAANRIVYLQTSFNF